MNIIPRILSIRDRARIAGMKAQKRLDAKTIGQIHKQYAADIARIRTDERRRYEALLEERNEEISRLHVEINSQRRYFQEVVQLGVELNSNVEEIADLFKRGFDDIGKGLQKIERAKAISSKNDMRLRRAEPVGLKVLK